MIDLRGFFNSITDLPYCLVKRSGTFPRYIQGEDLDIFCYEVDGMIRRILHWGREVIANRYEISVETMHDPGQVHVDFNFRSRLDLRFDLYGHMPFYEKICLRPALFESIIENSILESIVTEQGEVTVRVPCQVDDMLIRYCEFVEWYDVRPDKIKHLDHIMNSLDLEKKNLFLSKLHHYTSLPQPVYPEECQRTVLHRIADRYLEFRKRFLEIS